MRKYNLILFLVILSFMIIPLVNAAPPFSQTIQAGALTVSSNLPVAIPQNQTRYFDVHIINDTKIFGSGVLCFLNIYAEDKTGAEIYKNSSSVFSGIDIIFAVNNSVHESKGFYSVKAICNTTDQAGIFYGTYYVTKNGLTPADDIFKMFIYTLFFLGIIGLFFTLFTTLANLATSSETFSHVLLSWVSVIIMLFVVYLSENYLITTYVENLANSFITITIWTNGVLPLISLIITMFIKSTQKKKPLGVNELAGRGLGGMN